VAVLRYFNEIYEESIATPAVAPEGPSRAQEIVFNLQPTTVAAITDAEARFDKFCASVECKLLQSQVWCCCGGYISFGIILTWVGSRPSAPPY